MGERMFIFHENEVIVLEEDGGRYADVMRTLGAQSIFAVDVGSQDNTELTNYGDTLSGWWLLWKRWNPWATPVRVPDMQEIQSRLAYVSCMRQLEIVKNSDYCEYIRPPIDKYGTLQFGMFDEILDVGYNHGKTMFSGWEKGGLINKLFSEKRLEEKSQTMTPKDVETQRIPRLAYFTDLAELVSKIDEPRSSTSIYEADDEEDSDAYEDEDILKNINQHSNVKFNNDLPYGDPILDDDDVVDDDDDDQYVTDSEGETEQDGGDIHAGFPAEFVKNRFNHSKAEYCALPRRLSGYLKK